MLTRDPPSGDRRTAAHPETSQHCYWGDLERARDCYKEAAYYEPKALDVKHRLGEVLLQMGDYAAAEREYRIILDITEDPRARYNLACALARQGRGDEAVAELKRAVELEPGRYKEMAARDEDLASLRGRGDFKFLVFGK